MPKRCPRSTANPTEPETHIVETVKRICNRNFNIATVINLLVMTIYYLIFVTSTDYIRATYAVSLSTAGFTAGIMVIGCLVGRFISGNLLSLIGCKSVLFLGLLVHAVSLALFFIAGSLFQIFIIRFLTGLGVGVTGTATATVIAYVIPKGQQGFGIGLFSMSTALALALGPFLGIFLIRHIDYNTIMQLNFAAALLCGAVSLSLKKLPRAAHRRRPFFHINSYTDPRVVRFSCVVLLAFLSYGCIQAFMTAFAAERGLSGPASLFFPVYAVAALASRPLTGRQLDSRGENIIFFPIFILITLGLFLLAKAATGWLLLASGLLFGLGFGNLQSVGQAVSLTLVTPSRFAQATTTFFIFMDLGIGLGPYLFGFLVPIVGFDGMYLSLITTIVMAALLYYQLHGKYVSKASRHGKTSVSLKGSGAA